MRFACLSGCCASSGHVLRLAGSVMSWSAGRAMKAREAADGWKGAGGDVRKSRTHARNTCVGKLAAAAAGWIRCRDPVAALYASLVRVVRRSAPHWLVHRRGQKEGVHNVHTLCFGLRCTGVGLVRIGDVFGGVAGFQGLAPGSSPTSGTCFPCSEACGPLSVHILFTCRPLPGPFSLLAGCLLAFLDRRFVVPYLFMDVRGLCNMT